MLNAAQERARGLGIDNVALQADRRRTSIDIRPPRWTASCAAGATCCMADPEHRAAETRRVLKPGGRLALAAWAAAGRQPVVVDARRELARRGLSSPRARRSPGQFAWAEPGVIAEHIEDAGFVEPRSRPSLRVRDADLRRLVGRAHEDVVRTRDADGRARLRHPQRAPPSCEAAAAPVEGGRLAGHPGARTWVAAAASLDR